MNRERPNVMAQVSPPSYEGRRIKVFLPVWAKNKQAKRIWGKTQVLGRLPSKQEGIINGEKKSEGSKMRLRFWFVYPVLLGN
jgi:hypothetical protein